ncbi:hypothetical protein BU15DRAFT_80890 [Melanogaster broomeanus]|nr:hypothetical protein BU15DRAFT_80890 [Melanogaster broomeanus]
MGLPRQDATEVPPDSSTEDENPDEENPSSTEENDPTISVDTPIYDPNARYEQRVAALGLPPKPKPTIPKNPLPLKTTPTMTSKVMELKIGTPSSFDGNTNDAS